MTSRAAARSTNWHRIAELQMWAEQVREQHSNISLRPADREHLSKLYRALLKTIEDEKTAASNAA